jgi:hypothetical protein
VTFSWNRDKNAVINRDRGISFERVVVAVEAGDILAVLEHPNPARYPGQQVYVVEIDGYAWAVPYRDEGERRVLLTAYPSRRLTRDYLRGADQDERQPENRT